MKRYLITPHDDIKFNVLNTLRAHIIIEVCCRQSFHNQCNISILQINSDILLNCTKSKRFKPLFVSLNRTNNARLWKEEYNICNYHKYNDESKPLATTILTI